MRRASNTTFTIDNKAPTVALTYALNRPVSSADTLAITATFSQGMSASPQISIVNATGDSIQSATSMTGNAGDTNLDLQLHSACRQQRRRYSPPSPALT